MKSFLTLVALVLLVGFTGSSVRAEEGFTREPAAKHHKKSKSSKSKKSSKGKKHKERKAAKAKKRKTHSPEPDMNTSDLARPTQGDDLPMPSKTE